MRDDPPVADDGPRRSILHLQTCLTALEKIKSIAGDGPIAQIAQQAIQGRPFMAGGTDD